LSGTIFALVFHPWLMWVQSEMHQQTCMKFNKEFAYADDLLILLQDIWGSLVKLHYFCAVLFLATGLELNIRKTCIVPLWPHADLPAAKGRLSSMVPSWKHLVWDLA
jgi:hypothetical protein